MTRLAVQVPSGRILVAIAGVVSCALVTSGRTDLTPVDSALPFLAVLISLLGLVAVRSVALIDTTIPLLVVAAIAIPDESLRLLSYGALFAFAALLAIGSSAEVPLWRLVGFVVIMTGALRAIPLQVEQMTPLTLLLIGIAALAAAVPHRSALPLIVAVGLVTPLVPARASLFPLIVAAVVTFTRSGSAASLIVAVMFGLIAGKWALLLIALAAMPSLAQRWLSTRRRAAPSMATPFLTPSLAIGARMVAFAPSAILDLIRAPRARAVAAIALAAVGVLLRPALAVLYLLTAVFICHPERSEGPPPPRSEERVSEERRKSLFAPRFSLLGGGPFASLRVTLEFPAVVFTIAWLVVLGWSGALAPSFPLPMPLVALTVVSLLTTLPLLARPVWLGGVLAGGLFLMVTFLNRPGEVESQVVGRALAAGEAIVIQPQRATSSLSLVVSGANVSVLRPGASVGRVEFVDRNGKGYGRDISIGEVADWGAFRPAHFFVTRNPVPEGLSTILEYGSSAFLPGVTRLPVTLDQPITTLRVSAAPTLPAQARLELHRLELPKQ